MAKKVDFYRLPRPVQDRFAAATRRSAPPAPLLFQPAPRTRAWGFLGASLLFVVAEAVLMHVGWGDVESKLALHRSAALVVDVVLLAAATYCVIHAAAILRALDAMPWRPGTYLFPACVVDAREAMLQVWPVGDADSIERVGAPQPGLALRMRDGSRVIVPAASVKDAERADAALSARREELARATATEDPHMLAELDPLHDSALSNPIGPSEAMRRSLPAWIRLDWVIAVIVGTAVGLTLAEARNTMSDEAMYRSVVATSSADQYRAYLDRGGRHAGDVREILLPRAELQEALAQGTVEAIKAFADANPGSKIGPEIDAALRQAMLVELDKAQKVGTVAALDEFSRKYPDHLVDRELKAARHALYAQAIAAWKGKADIDASTATFMDRLFAWAEKNGAAFDVRFRMRPPKTLDDADKSVIKSGHYPGPDALPSKYVTTDAFRPREERVAQSIAQAFDAAFPSDVLALRSGEPLAPDAPLPAAALVVEYSTEWSHANAASFKPPTVFAGLNFTFDVSFVVPDVAPLKVQVKAWRGSDLWKYKSDGISREDFEQKVYDGMIDGAFDLLEKKLEDTFF
jgi:hypothetical protein